MDLGGTEDHRGAAVISMTATKPSGKLPVGPSSAFFPWMMAAGGSIGQERARLADRGGGAASTVDPRYIRGRPGRCHRFLPPQASFISCHLQNQCLGARLPHRQSMPPRQEFSGLDSRPGSPALAEKDRSGRTEPQHSRGPTLSLLYRCTFAPAFAKAGHTIDAKAMCT